MMELVRIFPSEGSGLFAVHFPEKPCDEFRSLFDFWSDPELLENFFEANTGDLQQSRYSYPSIDDAVLWTIEEAQFLLKVLYKRAQQGQREHPAPYKPCSGHLGHQMLTLSLGNAVRFMVVTTKVGSECMLFV